MRALKIAAVAVALLFIFVVFQNSYSQSAAIAGAVEPGNVPDERSPAHEEPLTSDPGSIQSVPGPPVVEGSITRPREQFAITEALLMVVAFVVLLILFILMIPAFIIIAPFVLISLPLLVPVNIIFVLLVMFLPVLLAAFADVSTYEIPASIQQILNDIGSKGTLTEILFSYFKNLWRIVLNLPDIVRLVGDLNTEDYANLIKSSGSFILSYPANLRALPNKILTNLFPTVNALPAWLRQSPVLLQVFPLLMYALVVLPVIAAIAAAIFVVFGLTITPLLFLVLLVPASPLIIAIGAIIVGGGLAALGFFGGAALGVIGGIIAFLVIGAIGLVIGILAFLAAVVIFAVGGAGIFAVIGALLIAFLGLAGLVLLIGGVVITVPMGFFIGLIIGGIIGVIIGGIIGVIIGILAFLAAVVIGFVLGLIAFVVIVLLLTVVVGGIGIILGGITAIFAVIVIALLLFGAAILAVPMLLVALVFGVPATLIMLGLLAVFILPLMLPIGPQAVKSYPAVFRLFLSLAENSIAIPLGCVALPVSALISVFRGLPGSLRSVLYHAIDFTLTPFLFAMRALPLSGTFVVLIVLWLLGAALAAVFSPFLCIAPVFIVLAIFVEGLKDDDIDAISDEGIKASIDNLPESVGEVDIVIERIAEMVGKAAATDISGLLDSLLGVNWLIVTQNLPDVLPEAMQSVGIAIPAIVNSCPSIIQTLIDSGLKLTIDFVEMLSDTIIAQIRNIFALIWALPEFAILIPQLLEILSVLTINLPALIKGFIPASMDAVEQTTISLPELFPSIVLSTMGLNVIVLQFARAVWRLSMRVSQIIIQILWYLILLLPATIFDFDDFVTPWFGPRLLSICGAACGAIPAGITGLICGSCSLFIAGCLECGMCFYLLLQLCGTCITFTTSCITDIICGPLFWILDIGTAAINCANAFATCSTATVTILTTIADIIGGLFSGTGYLIGCINGIMAIAGFFETIGVYFEGCITSLQPIVDSIGIPVGFIKDICIAPLESLGELIASIEPVIAIFFMILVIIALFPLIGIVAAFAVLIGIYFAFYIMQIFAGTVLMACSGVFQSVVFVPLMALCDDVPVVSTILGYLMTLTGFYAFCIPPNFIEIITQLIPLGVNLLASLPALAFMPISLFQTFISTSSTAVEALPSVPAYLGRLTDRIIFSFVAEILALISLAIDSIVAATLSCFALATGLIGECLSLSILTDAPKIAVLVLALIFVMFAWIIDLCGILCLRAPDMIEEYAYSILKSMAMMPVLSAIIPDMAAAPAAMQPEVVSEGLSKILIIMILFIPAVLGAFVALIYNLLKETVLWCYNTFPALVTLPFRLPTIVLNRLNEIFSQVGSIIGGAAGSVESQLLPY